ncbi:VOC domain-containing protein OS=Streptomyces albaduncus OX=68172 GN=FHS32_003863 PE=4 SV=1 [Streptomyces griseoloalbus]
MAPPAPFGDLGRTALVTHPEGAVFSLWQPGTTAGFGRCHEPGAFAWVQLYTRDTDTANAFYGDLFHDALFGEAPTPTSRARLSPAPSPRSAALAAPPRPLRRRGTGAALQRAARSAAGPRCRPSTPRTGRRPSSPTIRGRPSALLRR